MTLRTPSIPYPKLSNLNNLNIYNPILPNKYRKIRIPTTLGAPAAVDLEEVKDALSCLDGVSGQCHLGYYH